MFRNKVEAAYIIVADALDNKFKQLAADIISLEYAPAEEQKLLSVLKEAYKHASKSKRTKSQAAVVVEADMNWDAVIKENREKKERVKKDMKERNEQAMFNAKRNRPSHTDQVREPIKKKVADEVHKMGNVIKFDFQHPKKKDEPERLGESRNKGADDVQFGERIQRIRNSLDKINRLMTELRELRADDPKPAKVSKPRKAVPAKKAKPKTKKKPATRKKAG